MERLPFEDAAAARAFLLAGNATVTLQSRETSCRYTFKVQAVKQPRDRGPSHFVKVLNGPDNTADYVYLGMIRAGQFEHGRKSAIGRDAPSCAAFTYAFHHLALGTIPPKLLIWHESRCGRCGRPLTVPESIKSGLGPECAGKVEGGFFAEEAA